MTKSGSILEVNPAAASLAFSTIVDSPAFRSLWFQLELLFDPCTTPSLLRMMELITSMDYSVLRSYDYSKILCYAIYCTLGLYCSVLYRKKHSHKLPSLCIASFV